ncbi:unnamed protein product [Ixodes pacificus]
MDGDVEAELMTCKDLSARRDALRLRVQTQFRRRCIERSREFESYQSLARDVQKKKEEIEQMQQAVVEEQRHVQQLEAQNRSSRKKLQTLSDACAKKQVLLQSHTEVVQLGAPLAECHERHRETVNLFATWMGLELIPEPTKDKSKRRPYRAFLSLLDPRQPERKCSFLLNVAGDGRYQVSECDPAVADLEQLVLELNQADNLSKFFSEMRARFKAILNPTSA